MKKKKRKKHKNKNFTPVFLILILIAAIGGVTFAACGGGDDKMESEDSSFASTTNSGVTDDNSANTSSDNNNSDDLISNDPDSSIDINVSGEPDVSEEQSSEDVSGDEPYSPDLENARKKYSPVGWYKEENLKRYAEYGEKNGNFTKEQVVTYVNMGLDNPFYTNTYKANENDGLFILVNKYSYVDENYNPKNLVTLSSSCSAKNGVQLVKEAAEAFEKLSADAKALHYSILGMSGYRTYAYQKNLYDNYYKKDPTGADTYSARPGFSEHHTGLALDVQAGNGYFADFGQSKEYEWLLDNAHIYGFVIHYTEENRWITGYMPEEWHIRYLGVEAATYIYDNNLSVDEYLIMFGSKSPSGNANSQVVNPSLNGTPTESETPAESETSV